MHIRQALPKVMVIFSFLTFYIGNASCQAPDNDLDDHAISGNYLIVYCNANRSNSHAAYLQALILDMQSNLQAVLSDLDRGTDSPAYRAFFKTNNNLDAVRQVFTDIIIGSAFQDVDSRNHTHWSPPTLVCTDAEEPFLHHLRHHCVTITRTVMFITQPDKLIGLCPIFWTLPRVAREAACPWVDANGELLTEPWNLRTTQFAVLVHELVHLYNPFDRREEVYDMAEVVGLDAERSLENAQNFASYAAGESGVRGFSVCDARDREVNRRRERGTDACVAVAIQAGCTKFPTPPASVSGDDFCRGRCLGKLNDTLDAARTAANGNDAGGGMLYVYRPRPP